MLGLAAAAVYGTATALQHHAASGEHSPGGSSRHLLARLPPRRRRRHPLRSDRGTDQSGHSHGTGRLVLLPIDHWSTWLVVPTGLSAFVLSQWAYEATQLSVSVPTLNIVDVVTALLFSSVVFDDHVFSVSGRLLVTLAGITLVGIGLWRLVQLSEQLHKRQAAAARLSS